MKKMSVSPSGVDLIKTFEGCRLEAYKCPAGIPTIGYGHTNQVKMGMKITQEQADKFLLEDIRSSEVLLNKMGINFRQHQFDALCSWIFNLGVGKFKGSTMYKCIMDDMADITITDQIVKWVNAGGKPMIGLKKRRIAEANMFLNRHVYYLDDKNNITRL